MNFVDLSELSPMNMICVIQVLTRKKIFFDFSARVQQVYFKILSTGGKQMADKNMAIYAWGFLCRGGKTFFSLPRFSTGILLHRQINKRKQTDVY